VPVTDPSPVEPSKGTDRLTPTGAEGENDPESADPESADGEKDPKAPEQKRKMEAELDQFLRPS
jgi:hypothetical protein